MIKIFPDTKKHCSKLTLIIVVLILFASCATLTTGTRQTIIVKSEPSGANVYVNGQNTFEQTPCKVQVNRRQKRSQYNQRNVLNIEAKKEGYEDVTMQSKASFNSIAAVGIFFGGIPFLVDLGTGAHLKYERKYFVSLQTEEEVIPPFKPMIAKVEIAFVSDVDEDIPQNTNSFENRYALVIGNEDYSSYQTGLNTEANVRFAISDANSFKTYANKVLGVPSENIISLSNATLSQMQRGVNQINLLSKTANGDAEIFFYYAGHGLPHETTKEPYILPVDVSGTELEMALKLSDVYAKLTEFNTKRVTCFLDCCFSGGARNQGLVASRGVKITPKNASLSKNLVVYSASSGQQSALTYNEQHHGIFTYFLLRKLKQSAGDITYSELADYLNRKVSSTSIIINNKEQSPQFNIGPEIESGWQNWTLK